MNQQRLKECLRYDADTGLFHWIVKRKGVKKGGIAGSKMSHGYIAICIDGQDYTAHRHTRAARNHLAISTTSTEIGLITAW